MQSTAPTVAKYLLELPPDRRPAIEAVRRVILANIDKDIEETMSYGSIGYVVPHRVFPGGYHCDPKLPVPYIGLASQKNHMAVYLMFAYTGGFEEDWIRKQYAAKGRPIDMGKCCLRFRRLEDLDLGILAEAIRRVPAQQHISTYVATVGADKWRQPPPAVNRYVPKPPPAVVATQTPPAPAAREKSAGSERKAVKVKGRKVKSAKKKPAKKQPAKKQPARKKPAKKKPAKKQPARKKPAKKKPAKKKPARKRPVKKSKPRARPAAKRKAPAGRRRRA